MGCTEIIGSGDRDKCHKAIIKHLFMNELPGNQETLSETGMGIHEASSSVRIFFLAVT